MDTTDPRRSEFAIVLDTAQGFALQDAVTCMWLLKNGKVLEAIALYATGEDYGTMKNAHAASDILSKAIKPIAAETYREVTGLHERFVSGDFELPDLDGDSE